MAFDFRTGVFMKQHSQQIITMLLNCPQPDCRQPLVNRNYLVDHLWNEHGIKRFVCLWPDCGKSFDDFEPLGQHSRSIHGRGQTWKCVTPNCTKKFRSHNRLHRHVYHHHSDGLFRCGHPGCAFGPVGSRDAIYSHYRNEHHPKGYNDPFADVPLEQAQRNNPCACCVRYMTRYSQNRGLPRCTHAFHLRCLLRWIRHSKCCPTCRRPITPVPPV